MRRMCFLIRGGTLIPFRNKIPRPLRVGLLVTVFVFAASFLAAQSGINGHSLSVGTSVGLMSGEIEEIVFINGVSDEKISQLNWQIKPLFYAGLDLNYGWQKNDSRISLFSNASFKFGFPAKTGTMEDRDWMEYSGGNYYPAYPWLNFYSEHENRTKLAFLAGLDFGVAFKLVHDLKIKAFLSYNIMFYSWEAFGGSHLYPPGYMPNSHDTWNSSEKIITYKQFYNIISPGVSFYGEFNRLFNAEVSFKITPLVFIAAEDNHIKNSTVYKDKPLWGVFIEPELIFSFNASKLITVYMSYSYRGIFGSRGKSVGYVGGKTEQYGDSAGAGYSAHNTAVAVKFNLF